tara:strand:- start:12404 stop:14884 length:2481 start_codon:yes stop_codon:yes gene_type:complete
MKYSLKNEYKKLLNEDQEIVSIKSPSKNYEEELYSVTFDSNEDIDSGIKIKTDQNTQDLLDVCSKFTLEPANKILDFINKKSSQSQPEESFFRRYVEDLKLNDIVNILNKDFKETIFWQPNTNTKVGRGEVSVNLAFYTLLEGIEGYKHSEHKEPDFVALKRPGNNELIKYSVKSFTKANTLQKSPQSSAQGAQSGTNFSNNIIEVLKKFQKKIFIKDGKEISFLEVFSPSFLGGTGKSFTPGHFKNAILYFIEDLSLDQKDLILHEAKILLYELRDSLVIEHGAEGIIGISRGNQFIAIHPGEGKNKLAITGFNGSRIQFKYIPNHGEKIVTLMLVIENLRKEIGILIRDELLAMSDSYVPQGKVLKEIYTHLFKKKVISEGGLAGHMMHPYEALDMTPRQIIDRIKEYSTSQKIIEKVDGQNLFFTVKEDGTLMFARNKEDMTHDDLVAKFTGHGAEKPFVEGGNAIKRGVEQWLQSAGPAAEMEIREVFHPDGETKSFINFEIMHPDKPNQIVYDEKYIVFHSIVDYVDGRKTIHSTNKGQRLEKIIRLMDSGISSAGFTLASNRTVNLNELTSVQIEDYVERIKEVALSLGIPEDITLGEGIENIIKQEIDNLGIEMDREKLKMLYDFVLYGEDRQGNKIKSKDFTANMLKSDVTGLRSLDLTSSNKALKKVQDIISPFKDVFVDLGVDLLKGVKSAYMSDETNQKNIELLRDKLQTAMNDLIDYMNEKPENYWEAEVHRLRPYLDKVIDKDITDIVATTVEGGVYDYQGDLLKVTGGFAPLNQILGAAYRDKKGIFPTFKEKFMQQESNRRSLKSVFNLIY